MARQPLKECATCGKSWKKRTVEDGTMCPYCGSTSVRDARMTDTASDARGGCGGLLVVLLLLIAAGGAGYFWYFHLRQPAATPATTAPGVTPPPAETIREPLPVPVVEEPVAVEAPSAPVEPEPAEPPPPPSREWYELARNYHRAGRDDLARAELRKVVEAGDPEWVEKARTMLDEIGEE